MAKQDSSVVKSVGPANASDADNKFQTPSCEQIGGAKNCSFECFVVVLSQRLAFLRAEKLYSLFHGLFRDNEGTREATVE